MFGFFKDKLKTWFGKSKEEVIKKGKLNPKKPQGVLRKEKVVAKAEKPKKEEQKKEKVQKIPKTKKELKEERKISKKLIKDIKKEGLSLKSPEEQIEEELVEMEKAVEEPAEKEIKDNESETEEPKKLGFFERLKKVFVYTITEDNFEEIFTDLEMLLLESNVAIEVVDKIKSELKTSLVGKEVKKDKLEEEIKLALRNAIKNILINPNDIIKVIKDYRQNQKEPFTALFFGINGAGKTTSIAKFAHLCIKNKLSVVLAAADTFRAASIEQISIHGERLGVKVIKHEYNSDPSAVGFDAIKYAKTNNIDVVLIDTAGRMHTKENLLHEMEKICRVTKPQLKVFVAEAVAGNDATEQAKAFNDLIGIDGSILSKTDVDEKGGTIISISYITKKPILYLGMGQNYEDLELFDKDKFIERLGL